MPMREEPLDRLKAGKNVSVPAMADLVGCHPNTLWKAIREGEVEAIRVGRCVLIPAPVGLRLVGLAEPLAA